MHCSFYHECSFLQCNNFLFFFLHISQYPLNGHLGKFCLGNLNLLKSWKHDWPRLVQKMPFSNGVDPTARESTDQISPSEWILILMYFSLIPFPAQNKHPHQNYPIPSVKVDLLTLVSFTNNKLQNSSNLILFIGEFSFPLPFMISTTNTVSFTECEPSVVFST